MVDTIVLTGIEVDVSEPDVALAPPAPVLGAVGLDEVSELGEACVDDVSEDEVVDVLVVDVLDVDEVDEVEDVLVVDVVDEVEADGEPEAESVPIEVRGSEEVPGAEELLLLLGLVLLLLLGSTLELELLLGGLPALEDDMDDEGSDERGDKEDEEGSSIEDDVKSDKPDEDGAGVVMKC